MSKDYYKILGLEKGATKEEIKKAYKQMAKKYHPDINKDGTSTEKFKEINEAAAVLGDDQKRQQYDQFGTAEPGKEFNSQGFDFSNFGFDMGQGNFDFGDIFDQLFGGSGRRGKRRPQQGNDLLYELEIELEDAAFGATKSISIPRLERCPNCNGTGAEHKSDIIKCPDCDGSGYTRQERRTPFGYFSTTTPCRRCNGSGEFIKNECSECDGTGVVKKIRNIDVDIPKGIEDGLRLRIIGEGEAGEKGASSGNLYVEIHIKEHKVFERHEDDLYLEIPISFVQATLGDEIEVPTLEEKAKLNIHPGTQTNTLFRMKGKGIPHLRGSGSGDEMVKVIIHTPEKLNKKQKDLLKEFEKSFKGKNFFKKVFE
jgi:molecular chaperone DnaJ